MSPLYRREASIPEPDESSHEEFLNYFNTFRSDPQWNYTAFDSSRAFRCLSTPGAFARQYLLYPESVVLNLCTPAGFYMERKNYHSYQIQFTVKGRGRIIFEDRACDLLPGDCYFIDCRRPHRFFTVGDDDWIHHGIQLNGNALEALFAQYYSSQSVKVTFSGTDAISVLFTGIASACQSKLASSDLIANQLLWDLITRLLLTSQSESSAPLTPRFAAICQYIEEHYADIDDLEDISQSCYISKFYLCREFRRQTGHSVMEYLMITRINAAKQLLLTGSQPVSEIAQAVGFHSAGYFYSSFHKYEGVTPLQFRKFNQ